MSGLRLSSSYQKRWDISFASSEVGSAPSHCLYTSTMVSRKLRVQHLAQSLLPSAQRLLLHLHLKQEQLNHHRKI